MRVARTRSWPGDHVEVSAATSFSSPAAKKAQLRRRALQLSAYERSVEATACLLRFVVAFDMTGLCLLVGKLSNGKRNKKRHDPAFIDKKKAPTPSRESAPWLPWVLVG